MKSLRTVLMSIPCVLLLGAFAYAGEVIRDDVHGFSLTLPDGFVANPGFVAADPNIIHGFVLGDPADDQSDIVLVVEKLRGTIGPERLTKESMPPGFKGSLFTTRWQGFEVDAVAKPEQIDQVETITYIVQIPIKRAAIQIQLFGAMDRDSELKALLTEILAGLHGESNWIPSAAPSSPVTSSGYYGAILLAVAVVIILGGLVVLWFISRKAPNGTVLVIAAGIYCAGLALAGIRVREIVLVSGALKMLGIAGGVLGIISIVRKRKSRDGNAT